MGRREISFLVAVEVGVEAAEVVVIEVDLVTEEVEGVEQQLAD